MEHETARPGGALTEQTLRRPAMRGVGVLGAALVGVLGLESAQAKRRAGHGKKTRSKHRAGAEKNKGGGLGPAGPVGPVGPRGSSNGITGPTGPDGIPGPTGKSAGAFLGVTTVQAGQMVQHGVSAGVQATCPTVPADQQIIATGGGINATDGAFMIAHSGRSSPTSWTIIATNIGGTTSRLGAYVVCMWFSK